MREILFRGKSVNDGEWVYGSLVITTLEPVDDAPIKHYHIEDMTIGCFPNEFQSGLSETVDPNTVGQFTGLTDKNGTKIFEGDIVEGHCHSAWCHELQRCEVAYGRYGFEARHHVNCGGERRYYAYKVLFSKDVVVIGNIHDNPELLEVE